MSRATLGADDPDCPQPPSGAPIELTKLALLPPQLNCDPFATEDLRFARPRISTAAGELSPYWAQEATGSDLAAELLDKWDSSHPNEKTRAVRTGVIDSGFNTEFLPKDKLDSEAKACVATKSKCKAPMSVRPHGTLVANLIAAPSPAGTGSRSRITRLASAGEYDDPTKAVSSMLTGDEQPELVNMSLGCKENNYCEGFTADLFEPLASKSIFVVSAGNHFPDPIYDLPKKITGIVVGSTAPSGELSDFSQEGPEVTITAPSNDDLAAIGPTEDKLSKKTKLGFDEFSGTSGAAPQVTGALSNVMSLLPGLTVAEAKALLARTAVKTSGYVPDNGKNGAGQLNAYKMAAVAERLKLAGWPESRGRITSDGSLYDFADNAQKYQANAIKLLESVSCKDRRLAARLLRKAFLLDSENQLTRKLLAQLYRDSGLYPQANFYERASIDTIIASQKLAKKHFFTAIRHGRLTQADVDFYATQDDELQAPNVARFALAGLPLSELTRLLSASSAQTKFRAPKSGFIDAAKKSGDIARKRLVYDHFRTDPDGEVRAYALIESATDPKLPLTERRKLLHAAATDASASVQRYCISLAADLFAGEECTAYLAAFEQNPKLEAWRRELATRRKADCKPVNAGYKDLPED